MKFLVMSLAWLLMPLAALSVSAAVIPNASKSEYFKTDGAMFLLERTNMAFRYWLSLSVVKPLPENGFIEAVFENPTNKNSSLMIARKINGTETQLKFESSSVHGLKYRKNYDVDVRLFADSEKKKLVSTHKQQIQYAMPPKELKRITEVWKKNRE